MKIAFFNKNLPSDEPNGVSIQVHYLANALVELGHEVTCFSFSPPAAGSCYKTHVFLWGKKPLWLRKFTPAIKYKQVRTDNFDIMHYHGDDYLCSKNVSRVRTFYGSALQEAMHAATLSRFLYQALFYFFEWISCLKPGVLVGISVNTTRSLPFVKRIIPCGVPLHLFTPEMSSKTSHPSILFIGSLRGRKRGNLLVRIFQKYILPRYPDCILTVIGPQPCSGRNIIYKTKLPEHELVDQYRSHWIYCQVSSYEGFGVPVLEAMACATAVVATKNAGAKEIITDGVDGFCCRDANLAKCISTLIEDEKLRNRICTNGLNTVKKFDMLKVASLYVNIYQELQKKKMEK